MLHCTADILPQALETCIAHMIFPIACRQVFDLHPCCVPEMADDYDQPIISKDCVVVDLRTGLCRIAKGVQN